MELQHAHITKYKRLQTPQKDVQTATDMFENLGFKVTIKTNLNGHDISETVKEFLTVTSTADGVYSCLAVYYSGHGDEEGWVGIDGKTFTHHVLEVSLAFVSVEPTDGEFNSHATCNPKLTCMYYAPASLV